MEMIYTNAQASIYKFFLLLTEIQRSNEIYEHIYCTFQFNAHFAFGVKFLMTIASDSVYNHSLVAQVRAILYKPVRSITFHVPIGSVERERDGFLNCVNLFGFMVCHKVTPFFIHSEFVPGIVHHTPIFFKFLF